MPIPIDTEGRKGMLAHCLILVIVCFFTFFLNNSLIPADLMESRNLATAQEMVKEGNYLTPTMNGEFRFEKPPLPTWVAAGIEIVLPGNLVAQRCAAGVMGTLLVFFLYLLLSHLTRNRALGLMGALVSATSFSVILMSRTATWDIYCHSFMLGAIYFMVLAFSEKGAGWRNFCLAGLFLGLSFLGKGPVSFYALLLPFLIAYIGVYRPSARRKGGPLAVMVLICLLLSSWWTVYNYIFHPEVFSYIIEKETTAWVNHNVRPWYYYWQFPAEAGIWALFLVTALVSFFVNRDGKYRKEYKLFVIWLLASVVMLSLLPEKKTRYLLPILVPAGGAVAFYMYRAVRGLNSALQKVAFRANGILIAVILCAIAPAMYFMFYKEGMISVSWLALIAVLSCSVGLYVLFALFSRRGIRVMRVFGGTVAAMLLVTGLCLDPIGYMFINADRHSIRMLRSVEKAQGLPFFSNSDEELRMELVYEANAIIRPLDVRDTSLVDSRLPFVFISGAPVDSVFDKTKVTIDFIGKYDNNWRKTDSRRYNPHLVREAAIIRRKD